MYARDRATWPGTGKKRQQLDNKAVTHFTTKTKNAKDMHLIHIQLGEYGGNLSSRPTAHTTEIRTWKAAQVTQPETRGPVVADDAVNCLGHKFEQQVQVDLLWLLAIGVEATFQLHDIHVSQLLHDLHLDTVMIGIFWQACTRTSYALLCHNGHMWHKRGHSCEADDLELAVLESLVLQDLLHRNDLTRIHHRGLVELWNRSLQYAHGTSGTWSTPHSGCA